MADVTKRRKIRAAEAKRDALMEKAQKTKQELAMTRAQLKTLKKRSG